MAARAAAAGDDATETVKAPLFASLIERVRAGERHAILDLGPARAATVALFDGHRCRLDIVDLPATFPAPHDAETGDPVHWAESALLPPRDEKLDIVLCWDLLNHLPPPALTALMNGVTARAQPGALVHALIVYASRTMAAEPAAWVPEADDRLTRHTSGGAQRDAPRYTPDDLARLMPGYKVERAMLLRNGMQEFLFRL